MHKFSFTQHGRIAVPLAVYFLTTIASTFVILWRGTRPWSVHLFVFELPRVGSEFSKIAMAFLIGSIIAGVEPTAFLNTATDNATILGIGVALACFYHLCSVMHSGKKFNTASLGADVIGLVGGLG